MPSSYSFTGAGLFVLDASPLSTSRVRVRFSRPPLRVTPANLNDALRAANYTLAGSTPVTVTSVLSMSDTQSVELVTSIPLPFGTWTVTVANVKAPGNISLSAPTSAAFTVAQQQTSLTAGTEDEGDAYNVIRKHFNAALDGSNWRALIAALSDADNYVWDLARNAFEQLFLTTASGKYLDRLASNDGNRRPAGMSDDAFRPLAVELATGRVTYLSILGILEAFYGKEALRAYADTDDAPFSLLDGQTIIFTFEGRTFTYTVNEDEFRSVGDATASELAVSLARFFEQNKLEAIAAVLVNPTTGDQFVRVYSESVGLRSSMAVTGTASVGFPTGTRTVYSGSRTVSVSQTTDGVLEVSVPVTADTQRNAGNAGYVYGNEPVEITKVHRLDTGVTEVVTAAPHLLATGRQVEVAGFVPSQYRAFAHQYDTPTARFGETHQQGLFSTSTTLGIAAPRDPAVAALSDGSVVVVGGTSGGGYAGDAFQLAPTRSTLTDGSPASGSTRFDYVLTTLATALPRYGARATALTGALLDQLIVTGGWVATGNKPTSVVQRLAGGVWSSANFLLLPRAKHQQLMLPSGQVLVLGGFTNTSFQDAPSYSTTRSLASCEIYNPAADEWLYTAPMGTARGDLTATLLSDGTVLAAGGYVMGQATNPDQLGLVAYWPLDTGVGGTSPDLTGTYPLTVSALEITSNDPLVDTGHAKVGVGALMCYLATVFAYRAPEAALTEVFDLTGTGEMSVDLWVYPYLNATFDQNLMVVQDPLQVNPSPFQLFVTASGAVKFSYYDGPNPGDVTTPVQTAAGLLTTGTWAHICIVGRDTGSSTATYSIYVNGELEASTIAPEPLPVSNANVRVNIGFAPATIGTNVSYDEMVDDVRVWNRALTPAEVRRQFITGAGEIQPTATSPSQLGLFRNVTNTAEIYNPDTDIWTRTKNMNAYRGGHGAVLLDSGDILVVGGEGYESLPSTNYLYALSSTEIYSPVTGEWRLGPSLPKPLGRVWIGKAGDLVYCGGTSEEALDRDGTPLTDVTYKKIYWMDTTKMDRWCDVADLIRGDSAYWGFVPPEEDWMLIGGSASSAYDRFDMLTPLQRTVSSSGGINGFHRVTVTSPTAFTIDTTQKYTSMYGGGYRGVIDGSLNGVEVLANPSILLNPSEYLSGIYDVSKTGGVATVTATIPSDTEYVWIGTTSAGFTSGVKTLLSVTATTFTYTESAGTASGKVWVGLSNTTPTSEASEATGTYGAFVLDPTRPTIRSVSTTTSLGLDAETGHLKLTVTDTADFPDGGGYVIVGYGTQYETQPLRYLEAISTTELLLESPFTPSVAIPSGTEVALMELSPTADITDSLWVTGSILAMLAAKLNVEESVANDVELQFNVIYPDDRGLGGENSSHSDKYVVWGPDTLEDPE